MAWFVVLLFLDTQVNFLSVHRDLFRGVDANTHLVSFDAEHGHGDFAIANNQALCAPTSQNQHTFLLTQFSSGTTVCKKKALDLQPKRSQPTGLVLTSASKRTVLKRAFQKNKGRGTPRPQTPPY